jgi:uncharacterized membrane protein
MRNNGNSMRNIYRTGFIALAVPAIAFVLAYLSGSMLVLDYIHVLIGAIWTGVDVFLGLLFANVIKTINLETRKNIGVRMIPMTLFFIPSASIITPLAGYVLAVKEGIFSFTSTLFIAIIIVGVILVSIGFLTIVPYSYKVAREASRKEIDLEKISRNMRIVSIGSMFQLIFQVIIISLMAYIVVYL